MPFKTDSRHSTDSRDCGGVMVVSEADTTSQTVGKPRLIHSRLIHATRLMEATSRIAASQALGREKRIAERARRREFAHHYKSAYRDCEGCNCKECDGRAIEFKTF